MKEREVACALINVFLNDLRIYSKTEFEEGKLREKTFPLLAEAYCQSMELNCLRRETCLHEMAGLFLRIELCRSREAFFRLRREPCCLKMESRCLMRDVFPLRAEPCRLRAEARRLKAEL
jgi:hypothetical protein